MEYLVQTIRVVAAVIEQSDFVLVAERSDSMRHSGLWEFPGGKVEATETDEQALRREIAEEIGAEIQPIALLHEHTHAYPDVAIRLVSWLCAITSGTPVAKEHARIRWLEISKLRELDWVEADIPVVEALMRLRST